MIETLEPDLREKVRAEQARRNALTIEDWKAGRTNRTFHDLPVMLRVSEDEAGTEPTDGEPHHKFKIIETSLGARIPYEDGERCFRFAIARRKKGWHRNGEQFQVGHYQLDKVTDIGITAGCHLILWDEVERFARQEGWIA